jgi:hypothetical protein
MKRSTKRTPYEDSLPSKTQQQFKDDCDIRKIIARRSAMGIPLEISADPNGGMIQDFSNSGDYRENLHKLQRAQEAFMALDPKLRQKFGNDPAELINYLQDDSNYDEALKLGLLKEGAQSKGKNDDKTTNNSPLPTPSPQPNPQA